MTYGTITANSTEPIRLMSGSERLAKISPMLSAGPVTTLTRKKKPVTRTVRHQRPRTTSVLRRKAPRIDASSKKIACWMNCQSTYLRAAIGRPITLSMSRAMITAAQEMAGQHAPAARAHQPYRRHGPGVPVRSSSRTYATTVAATIAKTSGRA